MDAVTIALLIVSIMLALWLCLPRLLVVLGVVRLQHGFQAGPEEVSRYWLHDIDEDNFNQLTALGFAPVGVYWEQIGLSRVYLEYVFTSKQGDCFAMLYPNQQIMPRRASFITGFTSGGVIFTKNYQGGVQLVAADLYAGGLAPAVRKVPQPPSPPLPARSPLWARLALFLVVATAVASTVFLQASDHLSWLWAVPLCQVAILLLGAKLFSGKQARAEPERMDLDQRAPLAEVLKEHRRRVQVLMAAGHVLAAAGSDEAFLWLQRTYHEHPALRRVYRSAEMANLTSQIFLLALAPIIVAFTVGLDHPGPWAALLLVSLVAVFVRYGMSSTSRIRMLRRLFGNPPRAKART
jgi:hypothetical protein